MNPLHQLLEHGQSYWLDNLTRGMIHDGKLERRVREEGLRGVTSNPAIFAKAISRGGEYDDQIVRLAREHRSLEEIYEDIVVTDIRDACDVLRPVYEESGGDDGFVSLEVSPHLAHDTQGTMEEARRLFRAVDRPNLLIKIPGTPEGVPAIEEMLYEGVNINITLLFSVEAYEAVARAYLRALERRLEQGKAVDDVASVASFFLSRIDVLVDSALGHRIRPGAGDEGTGTRPENLMGEVAVANAKLAYRRFRRLFSGERWQELAREGARPQRMLWASTSTKDPLYRDVKYVEPLIGPHTVNTLPERTIAAFADHGRVETTVEEGLEEARTVMERLEETGIDFNHVTAQLLHEGVAKFAAPYERLMGVLADRRETLLERDIPEMDVRAGPLESGLEDVLSSLDQRRAARRLAAGDPGLWTPDPGAREAVRGGLGWLDAGARFRDGVPELEKLAREVSEDGVRRVLLLGMGGSCLAAELLSRVFGPREGRPDLDVLDDTHPAAVGRMEREVDPAGTLFVVASKSGTTVETMSLYRRFFARAEAALGDDAARQFVAVTDPGTPLAREARERGFRAVFENPEDIGGRYSALSLFGLLPAALLGLDVEGLLDRARQMRLECDPALPAARHPGILLGATLATAARSGRDKVTLFSSEALTPLLDWLEQLLAESLGKDGLGVVPVIGEEPVTPGAFGDDRLFVHLRLAGSDDHDLGGTLRELEARGHPVVEIEIPSRLHLGGEFYRWELAVAAAGAVLGVNPFDQPDVESAKQRARELLETTGPARVKDEPSLRAKGLALYPGRTLGPGDGSAPPHDAGEHPAAALISLLEELVEPGDYVSLLAFFPEDGERRQALEDLRRAIWCRTGAAVTLGRGPRYLHSTGQLHKGGPDSGIFVLLTAEPGDGLSIPGQRQGFAELHRAQALGDMAALEDRGRRVVRLHLEDVDEGLATLRRRIRVAEEVPAAG